jgi:hypothetical protein
LRFLAFFPMRCCLVPSDMFPALTVLWPSHQVAV